MGATAPCPVFWLKHDPGNSLCVSLEPARNLTALSPRLDPNVHVDPYHIRDHMRMTMMTHSKGSAGMPRHRRWHHNIDRPKKPGDRDRGSKALL